ncbi:MAG: hypothetical protein WD009_00725 [Phycisphaeraceae bacterium]
MQGLIAAYLAALSIAICAWVLWDYLRGKRELMSLRNVFLAGFVLFQPLSGAIMLATGGWGAFLPSNPVAAGVQFSAMATVFAVVFIFVYDRGWGARRLAERLPRPRSCPSDTALMFVAIMAMLIAVPLRLSVNIPLVATLAGLLGGSLAIAAPALALWVWAKRPLNPVVASLTAIIFIVCFLTIVTGTFGRRGVLALGLAVVWVLYFARWRYLRPQVALVRIAVAGLIPILLVAAFTTVREHSSIAKERDARAQVDALRNARLWEGVQTMSLGQGVGGISMWLIDVFPEQFEYRHLHTLYYYAVYPTPRNWWEDKPFPLSYEIPFLALQNVERGNHTTAPGIVGHAAAEGGWYALFVYAVVFALGMRFLDDIVLHGWYNPLIVVAVVGGLGQTMGVPRGDTAVMAWLMTAAILATWFVFLCAARFFDAVSASRGSPTAVASSIPGATPRRT